MDNQDAGDPRRLQRAPTLSYGPDRRMAALVGAGAILFGALAALTADRPGRLLYALAGLALATSSGYDLLCWPRLIVSASGLRVRGLAGATTAGWREVHRVHMTERNRFGMTTRLLEFDAGEELILLSRRALNADPRAVAGALEAMRPPV